MMNYDELFGKLGSLVEKINTLANARDAAIARAEKAEKEKDDWQVMANHLLRIEQEWIDENNRLADECKKLDALLTEARKALEPFAQMEAQIDDKWKDHERQWVDCIEFEPIATVGDLRRAREMKNKIEIEIKNHDDGQAKN